MTLLETVMTAFGLRSLGIFCYFLCQLCFYNVNAESRRFLIIGDWGGLPLFPYRTPVEKAVATRLAEVAHLYNATFVLALGDNFYFDGVKNIEDARFQETYNQVFMSDTCDIDWYLVAGNHDHNGNVTAQIMYTHLVKRWNFPSLYYLLTFPVPGTQKTIDILMIDTIVLCGNSDSDFLHRQPNDPESSLEADKQWSWIEHTLSTSKAAYLLIAGHYPVYSIAEHGSTHCLVNRMMPLLHKYNVTAYLSGHDHNLQHLMTSEHNSTMDYFVIGAANFIDPLTPHRDTVPKGSSKFFWGDIFSLGGLAYVEASKSNLTFSFIEANGKNLYTRVMLPRH